MTTKTLEQEAREAAHEHSCSLLRMGLRPTVATERGDHYELGYLAAAKEAEQEIEFLKSKFRASVECLKMRDAEIAELRARVAELEGMVPRWAKASSDECRQLCIDGWVFMPGTRAMDGKCLMVPPIPLPEGK